MEAARGRHTCLREYGSTPAVGSSRITHLEPPTNAHITDTFLFIPPAREKAVSVQGDRQCEREGGRGVERREGGRREGDEEREEEEMEMKGGREEGEEKGKKKKKGERGGREKKKKKEKERREKKE